MDDANDFVIVKDSGIHQSGVFAKKGIKKDSKVIEYTGEKITKEESDRRIKQAMSEFTDPHCQSATFIFDYDDQYDIDGRTEGNIAKYINHSCDPNCEVDIENGIIWVYALRDINAGEELFFNYGFEIDDKDPLEFQRHPCKCKSQRCVGYILAEHEWPKLKDLRTRKY